MKHMKLLIIVFLLALMSLPVFAQQGDGQVCIRAFEDRNANSTFDANEPPITQGVGVSLMNALGVTVDSKLLVDSATASQGVVCFQQLVAGDYTLVVTSADYLAVTPTTFNATVVAGSVPLRFDFGGEVITTGGADTTTADNATSEAVQQQMLQGVLFGLLGAIVVISVMFIAGMMIYFGVFRRRLNRFPPPQSTGAFRPVTGPMPAYQPDTGPMPVYQSTPPTTGSTPTVQPNNPLLSRDPNEGSPPLFNEEDTDQMGSIKD